MPSSTINRIQALFCAALSLTVAQSLNAAEITSAAFDRLAGADVVILGETHDNPTHHANQAAIIERLRPKVVVFEMLAPCDRDTDGDCPIGLAARVELNARSWPGLDLYQPVFDASEAVGAEIYGAALPYEVVRRAIGEGAAAVFGEGAERFGLTAALPEDEQETREAIQDAAHCNAMPAEMLPGMVQAQRLRDAAFSRTTLEALEAEGGPVIVITGNGHARDWGMPRALAAAAPEVSVISLGQLSAGEARSPYDFWIDTPAMDRTGENDPCAAFKTN